jgi:hypothetical protein
VTKNGAIEEAIRAVEADEEYINDEDAKYFMQCVQRMDANVREALAKNEGIKQAIAMNLQPKYAIANENLNFDPQPDGRVKITRTQTQSVNAQ